MSDPEKPAPRARSGDAVVPPADTATPRILAVDIPAGQIEALLPDPAPTVVHIPFGRFSAEVMARVMPDSVVAPLFGPDFDVLDLVDRLAAFGFSGRLLAVTAPLPSPEAVCAEVRSHAGGIPFDLVVLGGDAPARL